MKNQTAENKKYKMTDRVIELFGRTLYRIEALRDFSDVKIGDRGGWIEKEDNLSHAGDCWIYDEAKVYDEARVFQSAQIRDKAMVSGNANISGSAQIYDGAEVCHAAKISGDAQVFELAKVYCNAEVYDRATVHGRAFIGGFASIYNNACIYERAYIYNDTNVYNSAKVYGNATIYGKSNIGGNSQVSGNASISDMLLYDDACVNHINHYMRFQNFGSNGRTTTVFKTTNGHMILCGCFSGTIDEFAEAVEKTHGDSQYGLEYKAIIEVIKLRIESWEG